MADSRLDVLSTLLRGAAIDGGAQSQRTLKAIAAHRAREPHHVLLHGWALLQRPERLGDDGAATRVGLRSLAVFDLDPISDTSIARVVADVKYWMVGFVFAAVE